MKHKSRQTAQYFTYYLHEAQKNNFHLQSGVLHFLQDMGYKMKSKLNKDKIIEKIEKNKKDIQKYQVKKIGVFGSFIKKNQGSNSDVDILVVFGKVDFEKYTGLKFMLEKMFKRKVDLVIEEDLRPELNYIKKEVQYAKI